MARLTVAGREGAHFLFSHRARLIPPDSARRGAIVAGRVTERRLRDHEHTKRLPAGLCAVSRADSRRPLHFLHHRCQCLADALALGRRDHSSKDLVESRILDTGHDVLPAIGFKNAGAKPCDLLFSKGAPTHAYKVVDIRGPLRLQNAVDCADERDQVGHGLVACRRRQLGIFVRPFDLIEDGML